MKHALLLFAVLLGPAIALEPNVPDPNPTFENHGLDTETGLTIWRFDWAGTVGWTYFIQWSDDLIHWQYIEIIESGTTNDPFDSETNAANHFLRLRFTNIPTVDPELADFDGDGICNLDELQNQTDPLDPDTDYDGVQDGFDELPLSPSNGNPQLAADSDQDGWSDITEILRGTSPTLADSDCDGVPDTLDSYPLDSTRSSPGEIQGNDTTAPTITLFHPSNATLTSSN